MASLNDIISPQDISYIKNLISTSSGPSNLYEPIDPNSFKDQATDEATPYFSKNLDLALKKIQVAKDQYVQTKNLAEKYQGQEENQYYKVQDRNFARSLQNAQQGFAGRGTFNSGFRRGNIQNADTNQQDTLDTQRRAFAQSTESRNLGFDQFLTNQNLSEEEQRLNIERAKQSEITSRETQLAGQAGAKQSAARDVFNNAFSNFLGGKLAA